MTSGVYSEKITFNFERIFIMNNIKEMTMEEIKSALGYDFKLVTEHSKVQLTEIEASNTFKIGDTEFIVLEHLEGEKTICITKGFVAEDTEFDEDTNNFAKASVLKVLDEFEGKIAAEVGAENMCDFEIDLTTDDGLKDYGSITRKTGLLTDVQYRKYSEIIEKYPVDDWWWLANAVSTPRRNVSYAVRCVACGGGMNNYICSNNIGVRAVCIFKSNIFVSE